MTNTEKILDQLRSLCEVLKANQNDENLWITVTPARPAALEVPLLNPVHGTICEEENRYYLYSEPVLAYGYEEYDLKQRKQFFVAYYAEEYEFDTRKAVSACWGEDVSSNPLIVSHWWPLPPKPEVPKE